MMRSDYAVRVGKLLNGGMEERYKEFLGQA